MEWAELWPPFGLSLRLGPLELHPVRFDELPELMDLIGEGIIADDVPTYPLLGPFALGEYTMDKRRDSLRYWFSTWAGVKPERWELPMTVLRDGEIAGVQEIVAEDFAKLRSVTSGSWLGVRHQGRGTGTLMRQAVAMFAIDHLGAREVLSATFHDNARSLAVGRKVGYRENGRTFGETGDGTVTESIATRLLPDDLIRPEYPLEVDGLAAFLEFIGL